MVVLYSSDYYPVFKKDVYAVSSLPHGYCYHFRYKAKYVSQTIKDKINSGNSLEGTACVVIMVAGNQKTNTNLNFIPVRLGLIVNIVAEDQTGLYHVYFSLGAFAETDTDLSTLDEKPQQSYLGWQTVRPSFRVVSWLIVVQKLKTLGSDLFFFLEIQTLDRTNVDPKIEEHTREPFFELVEGSSYLLKVSMADFAANKEENEIRTKIEGTDIKSNVGETISSGLDLDNRYYRLSGIVLGDISAPVNVLKVSSVKVKLTEMSNYSVRLVVNVKKDSARLRGYFGISILVFLGAGLLAYDVSKESTSIWVLIIVKALGLVIAAGSAAWLFYKFNKK